MMDAPTSPTSPSAGGGGPAHSSPSKPPPMPAYSLPPLRPLRHERNGDENKDKDKVNKRAKRGQPHAEEKAGKGVSIGRLRLSVTGTHLYTGMPSTLCAGKGSSVPPTTYEASRADCRLLAASSIDT